METKLRQLEASIAQAKRAKALIEHALTCPHRELSICPNFRAALKARLRRHDADSVNVGRASSREPDLR